MLVQLIAISSFAKVLLYQPRKIICLADSHFRKNSNRNEVVYQRITVGRTYSAVMYRQRFIQRYQFVSHRSSPNPSFFVWKTYSARFIFAAFVLLNCQAFNIALAFNVTAILIVVLVSG